MCSGAVNTFAQLLATRSLLGIFESVFGCGAPYFLSLFYQRQELGLRVSLLLGMSPVANCFASALAYGITQIRGSIEPWRYLFIIGEIQPPIYSHLSSTLTENRGRTHSSLLSGSVFLSSGLTRHSLLPKRKRTNRSSRTPPSIRHNRKKQSPLVPSPKRIIRLQKLHPHVHPLLLQLLLRRPLKLPAHYHPAHGLHIHRRPRPSSTTLPRLLPLLRSSRLPFR